jgi:hypothetical protein
MIALSFMSWYKLIRRRDILKAHRKHLNIHMHVIYRIGGPYRETFLEVLKIYGPTIPVNNILFFFNSPL